MARQPMPIAETVISIDLDERDQRFGLAVAEAVVVVGRRGRDTNAEQGDEAGDQVEPVSASEPSIAIEPVCVSGPGFQR